MTFFVFFIFIFLLGKVNHSFAEPVYGVMLHSGPLAARKTKELMITVGPWWLCWWRRGIFAQTVAVRTLRLSLESDGEVCSNTTSCSGLQVTASHFWRLGFFFFRLKKQQHLREEKMNNNLKEYWILIKIIIVIKKYLYEKI